MTCARELYRRDAIDTSIDAAHAVDVSYCEKLVLEGIAQFPNGCIADDLLAMYPNMPYSSITARFAALVARKQILRTSERRKGRSGRNQSVLKINPDYRHWEDLV